MIVCICRAVSDRSIRAAIDGGAQTVRQVGLACRAGTSCGACKPQIASLLVEARTDAANDVACGGPCAATGDCAPAAAALPSRAL